MFELANPCGQTEISAKTTETRLGSAIARDFPQRQIPLFVGFTEMTSFSFAQVPCIDG